MNEQGGIAIGMALLTLALGSSLLLFMTKQLSDNLSLLTDEHRYIVHFHQALSAQAWGLRLLWQNKEGWHCQQQKMFSWEACVLRLSEEQALLSGTAIEKDETPLRLWQWLQPDGNGKWVPQSRGWIDFCPLKLAQQCQPNYAQ